MCVCVCESNITTASSLGYIVHFFSVSPSLPLSYFVHILFFPQWSLRYVFLQSFHAICSSANRKRRENLRSSLPYITFARLWILTVRYFKLIAACKMYLWTGSRRQRKFTLIADNDVGQRVNVGQCKMSEHSQVLPLTVVTTIHVALSWFYFPFKFQFKQQALTETPNVLLCRPLGMNPLIVSVYCWFHIGVHFDNLSNNFHFEYFISLNSRECVRVAWKIGIA